MSVRLGVLKKKELVDLAADLGVSAEGFKSDIESRIVEHLSSNTDLLSTDPKYASFYVFETRGTSMRRGRRTPKPDEKSAIDLSPTPFHVAVPFSTDSDLPSPAGSVSDFAGGIATTSSRVTELFSSAKDSVVDKVDSVSIVAKKMTARARTGLSTISTLNKLENGYELLCLLLHVLPRVVKVTSFKVPYGPKFSTPAFYVPDYKTLTDYSAFWQPLLFWAAYFIVIPLVVAYFFNFTTAKPARARGRFTVDPLTFNVTKLLIAYLLFISCTSVTETVIAGSTTVTASKIMEPSIPFVKSEPIVATVLSKTPFIGSTIGALMALYTAILA
ncbi:hypothetical protein V1512DRAFT_257707 [Lipomyces arxii]|uniref:uncharacterized protein n=1 Tax=Lipomyces arxii TaxID=56418 RepID=UPI0034CE9D83